MHTVPVDMAEISDRDGSNQKSFAGETRVTPSSSRSRFDPTRRRHSAAEGTLRRRPCQPCGLHSVSVPTCLSEGRDGETKPPVAHGSNRRPRAILGRASHKGSPMTTSTLLAYYVYRKKPRRSWHLCLPSPPRTSPLSTPSRGACLVSPPEIHNTSTQTWMVLFHLVSGPDPDQNQTKTGSDLSRVSFPHSPLCPRGPLQDGGPPGEIRVPSPGFPTKEIFSRRPLRSANRPYKKTTWHARTDSTYHRYPPNLRHTCQRLVICADA